MSILNEMESRCLIVTPEIMRQIMTSQEVLNAESTAASSSQSGKVEATGGSARKKRVEQQAEEGESDDQVQEELIKVHTVKSSSLLKFLLCESAKKAAAAVSRLASPFTQASPKQQTSAIPSTPSPTADENVSRDLIVWDESKNASKIESTNSTPAKKISDNTQLTQPSEIVNKSTTIEAEPEVKQSTQSEVTQFNPEVQQPQAEQQPEIQSQQVVETDENDKMEALLPETPAKVISDGIMNTII